MHKYHAFDQDINTYCSLLNVPGMAVGVAKGSDLIYFKGHGYADLEARTPITPDTIFWIASVTKAFTAIMLKKYEEAGRVSLNDELVQFQNKHFNPARLGPGITIGHVISHTSESEPLGSLFAYNGSRYNLVFNVFDALAPVTSDPDFVRPFTQVIEDAIITPLRLDHTITRVASERFEALRPFVVTPYVYDNESQSYAADKGAFTFKTSYPATGMLSSVNDLILFSSALTSGSLISQNGYNDLTAPFYKSHNEVSPYGQGWFTTNFEGIKLHWAYGYGDTDASLLLRIPEHDLTLIMLSNTAMPSAVTRMWYGNPLNSPIVTSFIKNFVLHDRVPYVSINYTGDLSTIRDHIVTIMRAGDSRLYLEEAFAYAMLMKLLPTGLSQYGAQAAGLLQMIDSYFPNFLNEEKVEAFDLFTHFDEPAILQMGLRLIEAYASSGTYHPIKSFYSGCIYEMLGDTEQAVHSYKVITERASFFEQPVKHSAYLALGKYYADIDPKLARHYLEELIQHKDMISTRDDEYSKAKALLVTLGS
ncbi:MAG: beta-lactamase family protein [Chloroflexi bacterium]|nr:beta-lactamase family protein [Chloroflexota bacterium]